MLGGCVGDWEDGHEELDGGPWYGFTGRARLLVLLPYMCGWRLLDQAVPCAKTPAGLVEFFLNVWGKRKDAHQARFHPFGQIRLEPLVAVIPFVRIVSRAKEISLFPFE